MVAEIFSNPANYYFLGGMIGGLVRYLINSQDKKLSLKQLATDVLVGSATSLFTTPLAKENLGLSYETSLFASFVLGIFGIDLVRYVMAVGQDILEKIIKEKMDKWFKK